MPTDIWDWYFSGLFYVSWPWPSLKKIVPCFITSPWEPRSFKPIITIIMWWNNYTHKLPFFSLFLICGQTRQTIKRICPLLRMLLTCLILRQYTPSVSEKPQQRDRFHKYLLNYSKWLFVWNIEIAMKIVIVIA